MQRAGLTLARKIIPQLFTGKKAILRLEDDSTYSLVAQYANGQVVKYELGKIQSNESGGQGSSHVVDHFVECVVEDKQPLITGEEGMKSLAVILAALESNETKKQLRGCE
ncbi:hypothetical protein GCM10020331_071970 [Ectobacillus funiculus]